MKTIAARNRSARRAFTMAEMMIAAVILAGGLIMVATMYPVAWSRAREVAEASKTTAATNAAETALKQLVSFSRQSVSPCAGATFPQSDLKLLGDFIGCSPTGAATPGDSFVHVLPAENAGFADPWMTFNEWSNGQLGPAEVMIDPWWNDPTTGTSLMYTLNPPAQIAFHERLFPSLPPRPDMAGPEQDQWTARLSERRFSTTVLYQFDPAPTNEFLERTLNVYFATLRLGEQSSRYPRQHVNTSNLQDTYINPTARRQVNDVRLPVPWLVDIQLDLNPTTIPPIMPTTGIPTQAFVGDLAPAFVGTTFGDNDFIPELFPPGTEMIDYRSGQMYKVIDRSINSTGVGLTLTLDREIQLTDVDDVMPNGALDDFASSTSATPSSPFASEDIRRVWVFPPPTDGTDIPVSGGGGAGRKIYSTGKSPLAGIEVRRIRLNP